jgi:cobalamin-dependent methionine synthase I
MYKFALYFTFYIKTEELFDAGNQLPDTQRRAIAKIIDIKIDHEMRELLVRMDSMSKHIDTMSKHMDMMFDITNKRIDRLESSMKWGFGVIISLIIGFMGFVGVLMGVLFSYLK